MIKMFKKNLGKDGAWITLLAVMLFCSCSDTWDDHYKSSSSENATSNKTLWEEISSNPDLKAFAAFLDSTGFDEKLNAYQMYTVWAPTGDIDASGLSNEDIEKRIVENHVSRYAYSAYPTISANVLMLNDKIMDFTETSGGYAFNGISLTTNNIVTKNGVLHILPQPASYFTNLWEYLDNKGNELDSLKKYMYSFTEKVFDEENSVESGVEDGLTIYADSVMIESNILWRRLGYLQREDSSYLFLAPTNKAWRDAYDSISTYFVFDAKVEKADSLQDYYTKYAIVQDLIFSTNTQESPVDSVNSTSKNQFDNPEDYIFYGFPNFYKGESGVECSNGYIFVTDSLRHHPWDSWQKEIKIEAENSNRRTDYTGCNIYSRDVATNSKYYRQVSSNRYIDIDPSSSAVNPTVTFEIPNTLSAGYDIYCVFVPPYVANEKTKTALPSKVRFQMSYHKDTGAAATYTATDTVFKNSLVQIDTILIAENFKFPVANYNQDATTVTLKIMTNVSSRETTAYTRHLYLDCIYLKPSR